MGWKIGWPSWGRRAPLADQTPVPVPKKPPAKSAGAERRETVRYTVTIATSQRLLASVSDQPEKPVQVRNLSAGGVSLVLHRYTQIDDEIDIDLLNRKVMFLCKVRVRVTYSVELPSGEWLVGGSFTRKLGDEEVRSLLA
jgi:hypothetical protein